MPAEKPIHRTRNLILAALAILLSLLGYQIYAALTATPGRAVDYAAKMAELIESNQPPDSPTDAWPVLRQIIDRMADAQAEFTSDPSGIVLDFSILYAPHLKPMYDEEHTWEQAEAVALRGLDAMKAAGIFDSLEQLKDLRRAVRPTPDAPLIEILLPDLGRARQLTRMNGARMRKALREGNEAEFVEAYEEILALGRMCAMQGTLIENLVGIAIVASGDGQVREALTEHPLSAATCEQLLAAMDRQLPLTPETAALEGERLCTLDIIQWTHTDDGHGSGRLIFSAANRMSGAFGVAGVAGSGGLSNWRILNLAGIAFPSKAASIAKANEFFDKSIAYAKLTSAQRRTSEFTPERWMQESLPARYLVLRMCIPAIEKAISSRTQCDMDAAGTRLQIAIELFNARNHRYPATLDELTPSILPAIPADPYPAGRFMYRLIKPEEDTILRADGSARPYLLYTCGADGVDNGGRTAKPNEYVALNNSALGRGFDFVLNQPRPRPAPEDAPAAPQSNPK